MLDVLPPIVAVRIRFLPLPVPIPGPETIFYPIFGFHLVFILFHDTYSVGRSRR